jgi:predicted DNA-binding antitoxin AbrB/MazE fold protein
MLQEVEAIFDGTALQLEVPLNLKAGTRVRIILEILPDKEQPKSFLKIARSLQLQGEPDWSEKIDQYLSGENLSINDWGFMNLVVYSSF